MKHQVARIHPADNVLVALVDLPIGTEVPWENGFITTAEAIPAKHKLAPLGLTQGQPVTMYGVLVGTAREAIRPGGRLTTANTCEAWSTLANQIAFLPCHSTERDRTRATTTG